MSDYGSVDLVSESCSVIRRKSTRTIQRPQGFIGNDDGMLKKFNPAVSRNITRSRVTVPELVNARKRLRAVNCDQTSKVIKDEVKDILIHTKQQDQFENRFTENNELQKNTTKLGETTKADKTGSSSEHQMNDDQCDSSVTEFNKDRKIDITTGEMASTEIKFKIAAVTASETQNNTHERGSELTETKNENPYATILEINKRKKPKIPPPVQQRPDKKHNNLSVPVEPLGKSHYTLMSPKVPLPQPPREDLSELDIPKTISTTFKGLQFQYEAFVSHILHTPDPFCNNFKQDNFSAGIFTEEGGILKINGAHLMIPNGALRQSTILFLYETENELAENNQQGRLQYQVTPTIIVGPEAKFEECIFLTINLFVVDSTEWTYTTLTRQSSDGNKWQAMKDSKLSLREDKRWICTLENISNVTEFKLIGSPKRKANPDPDGLYDVPIDHFITVKMCAVIDDGDSNELIIIVETIEKTKTGQSSDEINQKTVLLNQLGGEFLLMKLFGEEQKIHIGNILCGRQTSTKYSFKIPESANKNLSLEFRQELKDSSFHLNITHREINYVTQWTNYLRVFSKILDKRRFQMIAECGQCDHWVLFCKLAFDFNDAQLTHVRTLSHYGSFALNLYTAVNDICGNTLEVLKPLKEFLEKADILQAAVLVEEEIEELLSLWDKRLSGDLAGSYLEDGDTRDSEDETISRIHSRKKSEKNS